MTHERARRLVGVDQSRDLALGVFERAPDGEEVLHAVGRYLLDPAGRSAEMAFVVRESKRGLGICTVLLRTLLRVARHRGMSYLYAQVHAHHLPPPRRADETHPRGRRDGSVRADGTALRTAPAGPTAREEIHQKRLDKIRGVSLFRRHGPA